MIICAQMGLGQILQSVIMQGKKLEKAVYVLSTDIAGEKVAHVNFVPHSLKVKGLDARTWATKITDIIGGKVRFHSVIFCI